MRDIRFLLKPEYTNSRALIIGINKYKNASPLSYAVNDAKVTGEILIDKYMFPKKNVTFLIDEKATRNAIAKSFLSLTSDNIEVDERIFVFFAGHGDTREGIRGEVGYLVPYDADMEDYSTFIRWDDLTRNADLVRAKHMLFIMDACYGGLAITRNITPGSGRFLKDMMLRYSRQVLTAGKADEVVADAGGPIPEHSVFTGHLIEGLNGKAANEQGVLTANGLMAYVHNKVSMDGNSNQTPHYGYFDGDGDFIFSAPVLDDLKKDEHKDLDYMFVVPSSEDGEPINSLKGKVEKAKKLLADDSHTIELHDFLVHETKAFLSASTDDNFSVQGVAFSQEELLKRFSKYEQLVADLAALTACVSYWAKPSHKQILQKLLARSTDRLDVEGGLVVWINLRWYPIIIQLYSAGIAAVEGGRYDSLSTLFYTNTGASEYTEKARYFVEAVSEGVLELNRNDVFKKLPGHERHYTPISEYLFKLLQPTLDDILFIGKNYEKSFDEFEVLFALAVADIRKERDSYIWGPIGRFGWKHHSRDNGPLERVISSAKRDGKNWEPLKQGMFGGNYERFIAVAEEFKQSISKLNWW